jgi:hypothetical protein
VGCILNSVGHPITRETPCKSDFCFAKQSNFEISTFSTILKLTTFFTN